MATIATRKPAPVSRAAVWLLPACLPAVAAWVASGWPAWVFMWVLALAIYAGLKWLSFADADVPEESPRGMSPGGRVVLGSREVWTRRDVDRRRGFDRRA
jgi:hypothetical protein